MSARRQRGLSLVELMVALLIGLVVVAGAFLVHLRHLQSSRQLLAEVRLHQDLRAVVDLVTRDLRRAGHWASAAQQNPPGAHNPNASVSADAQMVSYRFDSPSALSSEVSFSLSGGRIRMQIGDGTPQTLTDPEVMTVTRFEIQPVSERIDLSHLCDTACTDPLSCPHVEQRRFDLRVEARSTTDARIVRALDSSVLLRNDHLVGACPAGT